MAKYNLKKSKTTTNKKQMTKMKFDGGDVGEGGDRDVRLLIQ
jgi:hypothetical protein